MISLAVVGAVLLLTAAWIDRTFERPELPWIPVAAMGVAREFADPVPGVELGSISVGGEDIVLGVVLMLTVGWLLRGAALQTPQVLFVVALGVAGFSVLRGIPEFTLPSALNEARETLYYLGAALLGSFAPVDEASRRRIYRGWTLFVAVLVAVALFRWAVVFTGLPFRGDWYYSDYAGMRVLNANSAMVLAVGFVMLLPRLLRNVSTRLERAVAISAGLSVILLQHRSVWAVTTMASAYLVWRNRRRMPRSVVMAAGTGLLVASIATAALLNTSDIVSQASRADALSDETWQWRVSGWADLLAESGPAGPVEYLIGQPYGTGWYRSVSAGYKVNVPPHNFYLELLLRTGAIGVGTLLAAGIQAGRRLRRRTLEGDAGYLDSQALLAILVVHAVYSVPYNLAMEQGLLLGLAVAVWAGPLRAQGRGMVIMNPPRRYSLSG